MIWFSGSSFFMTFLSSMIFYVLTYQYHLLLIFIQLLRPRHRSRSESRRRLRRPMQSQGPSTWERMEGLPYEKWWFSIAMVQHSCGLPVYLITMVMFHIAICIATLICPRVIRFNLYTVTIPWHMTHDIALYCPPGANMENNIFQHMISSSGLCFRPL